MTRHGPALTVVHSDSSIRGGLEIWLRRLCARLGERGRPMLVLCRNDEMRAWFQEAGVPSRVLHLGGQVALHDALRLAWVLRHRRAGALVLSSFKKAWLGALGGRVAGVPRVIGMIRWSPYRVGGSVFHRATFGRLVHVTVTNADTMRRQILEDLPAMDPRRAITLYNGVDPPLPSAPPGSLRRELGVPESAFTLGAMGRLVPEKRHDLVLRATAALGAGAHCVIAGDGPARPALEALAHELGVADRVHLTGRRDDVGDVLAALDTFVVASRAEGMSNAMLEALSVGLPVVSTPVSGAAEALAPLPDGRRPGMLVEDGVEPVAVALRALAGNAAERAAMGAAAREVTRRRFSWEDKLVRWETLLSGGPVDDLHEGPSKLEPPRPT